VLVPHADSLPWFENASIDFLGDVDADSFDRATVVSIAKQLADRKFAWVSKDQFHFAWSQVLDRPRRTPNHAREHTRNAVRPPTRKRRADRSAATR
jgi:hypothetical protein